MKKQTKLTKRKKECLKDSLFLQITNLKLILPIKKAYNKLKKINDNLFELIIT